MVNEPTAITFTETHTDISCNGSSDGAINVTVTNGTAPFTYTWTNGEDTEDISNLPAGLYSLTVTDTYGCVYTDFITIMEPSEIYLTDTVVNTTGTCNGYISISAIGGAASYTYLWNTEATGNYINGLCFGEFNVTVTDANLCTQTGTYLIGSAYTDTTTFVDTVQTSVDTCLFDNVLPIDSAYIYNFQTINPDSVLLNWVFWQDEDSILLNIGANIETQGNNLVYLQLACNNKSLALQDFYGMFNTTTNEVGKVNLLSEVNVFPNPSNGFITIKANGVSRIEIINISGKIIYMQNNTMSNQEVDLSNQPKGIYLVKVDSSVGSIIKKIIIE